MTYVDNTAVKTALNITGTDQDTQITSLINSAEALINSYSGVVSLADDNYTETHEHPVTDLGGGREFMLDQVNPRTITTIDGSDPGSYYIKGRKLILETGVTSISAFPYHHTIIYDAGFVTIPDDVKQAMYSIVGTMLSEAKQKSAGVEGFSQDKLSMTFGSPASKKYITSEIMHLLKPYKKGNSGFTGYGREKTLIKSIATP